jgi:hypothetical protein
LGAKDLLRELQGSGCDLFEAYQSIGESDVNARRSLAYLLLLAEDSRYLEHWRQSSEHVAVPDGEIYVWSVVLFELKPVVSPRFETSMADVLLRFRKPMAWIAVANWKARRGSLEDAMPLILRAKSEWPNDVHAFDLDRSFVRAPVGVQDSIVAMYLSSCSSEGMAICELLALEDRWRADFIEYLRKCSQSTDITMSKKAAELLQRLQH